LKFYNALLINYFLDHCVFIVKVVDVAVLKLIKECKAILDYSQTSEMIAL